MHDARASGVSTDLSRFLPLDDPPFDAPASGIV
jgi:hypothetical protein